ncbi:MAG: AAA family ATPase, partial [Myxococcota bacterium]
MVRADEPATERDGSPRRRIPGLAGDRVVRDGLVREVSAALDEAPGLVTLVGVGGAGKTFTAAAVARARTGEAGVAWVDLQRARNLADLERELAWALGLGRSSSSAALEAELMQHEALLLVLDNLEQLPRDVADRLEDWLDAAPTLRVLGTSRRRLGVAGERLFELTPLPVPREDEVLGSEMWALMGSWAPPGALSEVSAPVAKALLDELEGLPLAIRLAAGRLEVFDAGSLAGAIA